MKRIIIFTLLVTGFMSSCSSDNSSNEGIDTYFRFKINGQQYDMPGPYTNATGSNGSIVSYEIENPSGQIFSINMPFVPTVGSHAFVLYTDAPGIYAAHFQVAQGIQFESESGSIKIISVGQDFVKGTFNFTGTSNGTTYTVTDGEFRSFRAEQLTGRNFAAH